MKTVFDYLTYYNNITFDQCKFNDMDNIVFSTLAYLPLNKFIDKKSISIHELMKLILEKNIEIKHSNMKKSAIKILEIMSYGERYKDVEFCNYVEKVDNNTQFAAVTIRFFRGCCYVSFKGTDNSLSGWKENLELSYKYPIAAQSLAINYLKQTINFFDKIIYVGGHSKGGNLAMTSVMETDENIFNKIDCVYNNDGPGFLKEQFNSFEYKKMSKKLKVFMPEDSMVGILLLNPKNSYVVKSNGFGIVQHYLVNWNCFGQFMIEGKLSKRSKIIQKQMNDFIENTNNKDKELMINSFFDILEERGIKYFYQLKDLSFTEINSIIKNIYGIDDSSKQMLVNFLKAFLPSNIISNDFDPKK